MIHSLSVMNCTYAQNALTSAAMVSILVGVADENKDDFWYS